MYCTAKFLLYKRGEFYSVKELVIEINEVVRILNYWDINVTNWKSMGSEYARCNAGRKLLMEHSDTAATREMFLKRMHKISIKYGFEYQWGLKPRAILLVKASRKLLLLCMELNKQVLQMYTI
jgi:hypothetical protein